MMEIELQEFSECFQGLDDPRTGNAGLHELLDILMIALCTTLCGGQTAVDMAEFGRAKEVFLRRFLTLENGIPSHDTFSRVFQQLDPDQFRACFQTFMERFAQAHKGVIAIDGKVLRRSFDKAAGKSALHMVSAWGCEHGLVLAQIAVDEKSNEITAVPKLLEMLSLSDTIITVDALNCQRDIAERIVEGGGDYVLALKGNQPSLYQDVKLYLDDPDAEGVDIHRETDGGHGRIEERAASITTAISWLQEHHNWPGLKAIGKVVRYRETGAKSSTETAYYLISSPLLPARFEKAVRSHWGVENKLHWSLDVVMNEDQCRNRKDNGPYNLAILRHMALNLVNKEKSNGSNRVKFKRAGWNDEFLIKLLA